MSHRDGRDEPGGADEVASARDVRAEYDAADADDRPPRPGTPGSEEPARE